MLSFQLSAEQQEFRDAVRDFVKREVRPAANHPDRLQAGPAPLAPDVLAQASRMGLRALALSESLGGAGANHLTACVVAEELAAGDIDFATTLMHTAELARRLFGHAMSDAQREQFLGPFLQDDHFHLAYAGSDRDTDDGGWNYHRPEPSEIDVPVTAAQRDGTLVLNGAYAGVANAPLAKLFAVRVRLDTAATGLNGTAIVLVPATTPGLTVQASARIDVQVDGEPSVRWQHGAAGTVTFADCPVPASQVLQGCSLLHGAAAAAGRGSPLVQALNLGVGRAAYDAAVDYAKLRIQGGRLIIEHQAIGSILAEIALRLEIARNLVWKAAWAADHPDDYAAVSELPLQTLAKAYTSQAMQEATLLAAECFGAMGVMRDMTLPHYVNQARVFVHAPTSNATAKLRVAEAIAGFRRR